MKVTCKICGNKIERDSAFKISKETSKGIRNSYYCDSIEYELYQNELIYKQEIQDLIDEMLTYKCVNSVIYKDLANLKRGYTYREILNSFKLNKRDIVDSLKINGIDKEYNMIRYIFGFISRTINEDTKELKSNENIKKKTNSNELAINDGSINQEYTYKKKENVDFSRLF